MASSIISTTPSTLRSAGNDETSREKAVATFPQGAYRGVKAGDSAEVIFPIYPGLVFTAKVTDTIDITSTGQIPVGGVIPANTLFASTSPNCLSAVAFLPIHSHRPLLMLG